MSKVLWYLLYSQCCAVLYSSTCSVRQQYTLLRWWLPSLPLACLPEISVCRRRCRRSFRYILFFYLSYTFYPIQLFIYGICKYTCIHILYIYTLHIAFPGRYISSTSSRVVVPTSHPTHLQKEKPFETIDCAWCNLTLL